MQDDELKPVNLLMKNLKIPNRTGGETLKESELLVEKISWSIARRKNQKKSKIEM